MVIYKSIYAFFLVGNYNKKQSRIKYQAETLGLKKVNRTRRGWRKKGSPRYSLTSNTKFLYKIPIPAPGSSLSLRTKFHIRIINHQVTFQGQFYQQFPSQNLIFNMDTYTDYSLA